MKLDSKDSYDSGIFRIFIESLESLESENPFSLLGKTSKRKMQKRKASKRKMTGKENFDKNGPQRRKAKKHPNI